MKIILGWFTIVVVVVAFCASNTHGAESYDKALSKTAVFICLKELRYKNKLHNFRIAVYGFHNEETGRGCKALTASLANKMVSIIHNIKTFADANFTIVARRNLDTIETEYLISKGDREEGYSTVFTLLEDSDILITGTWQNGESVFVLNVKALEIRKGRTRVITSHQVTIDKFGLPGNLLDCLSLKKPKVKQPESESRPPAIRALQEEISRQDKLIEDLRKRRQTEERKLEMVAVIEERKKTIVKLMQKPGKGVAYTTRRYDENLAFVNILTTRDGLDIYINDVWVGKSPLKLYEIEAGKTHTITAKRDPRYFVPTQIEKQYDKFSRIQEKLTVHRGTGKILLLGKELFDTVKVDGKPIDFDPKRPIITVFAGRRRVTLFQEPKVASFVQDVWVGDVIRRDVIRWYDRFVRHGTSVVLDNLTGLEWVAGPDKDTTWDEARTWVQSLNLDGGGWRMSTTDELEGFQKKSMGFYNITSLLKATSGQHLWVWSGETKGSSNAWIFNFDNGARYWRSRNSSLYNRVFAVRSRGGG